MKITNEQKALAEKLTKLHIRPAVVKQEVMKLEPDVKECHVNNLVKNTRKRLGFYKKETFHKSKLNPYSEKEKERKKSKKKSYHHESKKAKKNRKLLIEDDFFE